MAITGSVFHNCRWSAREGQALVELAVFGAIFIMIVGAMISYGLGFGYTQSAKQRAFRRALKIASDRGKGGTGTYMLIEDKHIPDPTDPFGMGSTTPVSASASVTRTNELDARAGTATDINDLPTTVMDIQLGYSNDPAREDVVERRVIRSAGFRYETSGAGYSDAQLNKYRLIYSDVLPMDGNTRVRLIDSCSGHMVDYATCYDQAVMLVDEEYCRTMCEKSKQSGSDLDCNATCAAVLNAPNQLDLDGFSASAGGPWYAQGATSADGYWVFPVLDRLFNRDGTGDNPAPTGIATDSTTDTQRDVAITKLESTDHIVTQQSAGLHETISRNFVTHDNLNAQGEEFVRPTAEAYTGNIAVSPMVTEVNVTVNETWSTQKHTY